MKRVAIPIFDDYCYNYLGECRTYEIVEIDNNILSKKFIEFPLELVITDLPDWLEKQGVTDVIAYKVNKQIISLFASKKVNLFVGIVLQNREKLIEDYLNGKLESDKNIIAGLIQKEN